MDSNASVACEVGQDAAADMIVNASTASNACMPADAIVCPVRLM